MGYEVTVPSVSIRRLSSVLSKTIEQSKVSSPEVVEAEACTSTASSIVEEEMNNARRVDLDLSICSVLVTVAIVEAVTPVDGNPKLLAC